MDDLIRRGALLHEFSYSKSGTRYLERDCDNFLTDIHLIDAKKIIRNAPSVDAAEVVRCRECKNSGTMVPIGGKRPKRICWPHDLQVSDNDYCSRGARMDAQTDGEKEAKQDG